MAPVVSKAAVGAFVMVLYADFHIHSKYARAVSQNSTLENLARGAETKGVNILGTGDFTHPLWFKEIKEKLRQIEDSGIYELTSVKTSTKFMLTTEVATFDSFKRVHHVVHVPSLEHVQQLNDVYSKCGNLAADGRPMLGKTSCAEFVEMTKQACKEAEIVPAHSFTPWFGVLGDKSGYNSVQEAYGDKASKVLGIETGMSCYDSETEVLTNDGWKKVSEVKLSDEVCTLNPKTEHVEFQKPLKQFKYPYAGKMYRLKTRRVDLLVTPNHKLLYAPCDFRKKPVFSLKEAEFLFNKSKRFKKDGIWLGEAPEHFILPAVKMKHGSGSYIGVRNKAEKRFSIKPWLKFFGFWIAEGFTSKGKGGDYGVYLVNKDSRIISEMYSILQNFSYRPYRYRNRGLDCIRIRDYQLFSYLRQFGKAADKFISIEVKSLTKELLDIFFKYYIEGDGHIYGRTGKGVSATTISKRLRDDLQEIALKMGMSAYYKLLRKKGTPIRSLPKANERGYVQSEDSWNVYFIRHNIHSVLPSTTKKYGHTEAWVDYSGFVYCLEVPNHVIYVRRNGIPVWCGNSDPAMNWRVSSLDNFAIMSNSDPHSPHPWRLGRECNAFSDDCDSFSKIFDAVRKNDKENFLFTVETSPLYGKYHVSGHRACNFSCSFEDAKKLKEICPKCGKPLTIGVEKRIEELADRPVGFMRKNAIPFRTVLPLAELIASVYRTNLYSKKVQEEYQKLIAKFGNEFKILFDTNESEIKEVAGLEVARVVMMNRENSIKIKPGFDGEYGVLQLPEKLVLGKKREKKSGSSAESKAQKSLGEF